MNSKLLLVLLIGVFVSAFAVISGFYVIANPTVGEETKSGRYIEAEKVSSPEQYTEFHQLSDEAQNRFLSASSQERVKIENDKVWKEFENTNAVCYQQGCYKINTLEQGAVEDNVTAQFGWTIIAFGLSVSVMVLAFVGHHYITGSRYSG